MLKQSALYEKKKEIKNHATVFLTKETFNKIAA